MRKKIAGLILRIAVTAGIFIYIFSKPDISLDRVYGTLKDIKLSWLIAAFFAFKVAILAGSYRWQILMKAHNIKVNYRQALGLNYLGLFFNNFMLSLTGGDIVKAYYASRLSSEKRAESATVVFVDRLVGFSGLLILGVIAGLFGIGNEGIRSAMVVIFISVLAFAILALFAFNKTFARMLSKCILVGFPGLLVLGLVVVLFQIDNERIRAMFIAVLVLLIVCLLIFRRVLVQKLGKYTGRIRDVLTKVYHAVYFYRSRKVVLLEALGLSILVWTTLILINFLLAKGLGMKVSPGCYFVFIPVINIISSIPITIAGWGVRESMYVQFFGRVGVSGEVAFSLSVGNALTMLLWGLVGGVLYALHLPKFTAEE